ncbi:MAG: hypothetical protein HDS68_06360 [Bacteroidales bacterium]|nr:hypothetical protein [Bacteroidales bacterium]
MKSTTLLLCAAISLTSCNVEKQSDDWALTGFERITDRPVLSPDSSITFSCPMTDTPIAWMESDVFNPAATICNDSIVVLFRAEDNSATGIGMRTSRIGYAVSADGVNFTYGATPVLYPGSDSQKEYEWSGGCEDPRVAMTEDGTYVMFYTQWNRDVARLAVATSKNLVDWEKHGPAFAEAYDGRFKDTFSKSASIVTKLDGDRLVIAPIDGKYYMYWGEKFVNVATSDNLTDWTPMLDGNGELLHVMDTRDGYFDSDLTECGPPALLTDNGILLLYNGKNAGGDNRDPRYTANTYCGGQALFDADDPTHLITRLDEPFFKPEAAFEKSGQYPAGTVFIEGLVFFKGKWYLYYGCADSRVGVAVRDK